jgi:hypothetical protein
MHNRRNWAALGKRELSPKALHKEILALSCKIFERSETGRNNVQK